VDVAVGLVDRRAPELSDRAGRLPLGDRQQLVDQHDPSLPSACAFVDPPHPVAVSKIIRTAFATGSTHQTLF
jgi:hypothetical protein